MALAPGAAITAAAPSGVRVREFEPDALDCVAECCVGNLRGLPQLREPFESQVSALFAESSTAEVFA